jgi:glutamate racemase
VGTPSIGVFDSGVGGLSVAAALRRALPGVPLHYLADSAHAPYGERSPAFIRERSVACTEYLLDQGAGLLVLACNTATAHAAQAVRERWPSLPVVGIEPGIKPAVAASRNGRVGVLATRGTVQSERLLRLIQRYATRAHVTTVACTGVVSHIEGGDLHSEALQTLVAQYCAPLREAEVDTVLLGCTHYPLIRPLWLSQFGPHVQLLQVEDAVAQQALRLWPADRLDASTVEGALTLSSTADPAVLGRLAREVLGWGGFTLQRVLVPGMGLEPIRSR